MHQFDNRTNRAEGMELAEEMGGNLIVSWIEKCMEIEMPMARTGGAQRSV